MNKFLPLIVIGIMTFLIIPSIGAEQTVKTIEIPIGFVAQSSIDTDYIQTLTIKPPDRIYDIISFELIVKGDFQANTDVKARVRKTGTSTIYDCTPATWTIPNIGVVNYETSFDCSSLANKFDFVEGKIDVGFRTGSVAQNLKGYAKMTYYNRPRGSATIFGTEYEVGDSGTIFLQLNDEFGEPVDDGFCTIDSYYPYQQNMTHEKFLDDIVLLYLDDGLYYYDFTAPNVTGVYMISAYCSYDYEPAWFYNPDYYPYLGGYVATTATVTFGTHLNHTFTINSYYDGLYDSIAHEIDEGQKKIDYYYEWSNITDYINTTNSTGITFYWMGESTSGIDLYFYIWNWTSSSWNFMSMKTVTATASPGSPSGQCACHSQYLDWLQSYHVNGGGKTRIRLAVNHTAFFDLYTNWLNIRFNSPSGEIIDVKGSGELHVTNHFSDLNESLLYLINITENLPTAEEIWNYTTRTLTDYNHTEILQLLYSINGSVTDVNTKLDQLNLTANDIRSYQINELANNLTEIVVYLDYINTTTGNTYTYIQGLINLSAEDVWSYYNRTLTEFDFVTDIDYNLIQEYVWNYSNRTLTEFDFAIEINDSGIIQEINNLANLTAQEVWSYFNRTLTEFDFNITADANLTEVLEAINNLENLTAEDVWTYTNRTLTGFDFVTDINYDYIQSLVWNSTDRNLTFYQDVTDYLYIQSLIWNATNRTLTYYPAQQDLTQYDYIQALIWNATNRNLTYYEDVTNYLYIQSLVWNATNRTLTDYNQSEIFQYLNLINQSTYGIHPKLDTINYYTYQNWLLLNNLTLGNVSVFADINWTRLRIEVWNKTSNQKIEHDILSFADDHIQLVSTTDTCIDKVTLRHDINVTNCLFGQCYSFDYDEFEQCSFGCGNNQCLPPQYATFSVAIIIVLLIGLLSWIFWR